MKQAFSAIGQEKIHDSKNRYNFSFPIAQRLIRLIQLFFIIVNNFEKSE